MGTATKYPERSYKLYRQTHTGKITFYKQLKSYAKHSLKEGFDWDAFEANRGADL